MIKKLLIANRGEIARRVMRTCRALGIRTVAVYSDADARAPHVADADEAVRIGPAPSLESYLSIDRLLAAAAATGADAVHPGYGFLAENADFAERCAAAGLIFVGPPPEAIRRMGSKVGAREIMAAAGVPVVPGVSGAWLDPASIRLAAQTVGFPLLIKASAGGGGKGMRLVREASALTESFAAARREAQRAFGDDTLLVERYFDAPRHIEVQIFGDAHGRVVHLFERECSIQRRFQKVIEEAPSPVVDADLRARLGAAAVAAGATIGYVGAGTVEFIVDQQGGFYFLEVNTRLQVEHPVTEAVTGLDLVALQIRIAEGEPLPATLDAVAIDGHALEARLYAEAPERDFLPATGRLVLWEPPALPGVRWDSGVEARQRGERPLRSAARQGDRARADARGRHRSADRGAARPRRRRRHDQPRLSSSRCSTTRNFAPGRSTRTSSTAICPSRRARQARDAAADRIHAIAAAIDGHQRRRAAGGSPLPESIPSGWRNSRWRPQDVSYAIGGERLEVRYVAEADDAFTVECGRHRRARDVYGLESRRARAGDRRRPAPVPRRGRR
jgi:biotin carboxylase